MSKDVFTFIVGGKAGEGVKKAGSVAARLFINKGLHVFQMDDYMSLIRGGHNFSVISTAARWISSHHNQADLIVCFDKRAYNEHKNKLKEKGIMVYNSDEMENANGIGISFSKEAKKYPAKELLYGVGAIAILIVILGFKKEELSNIIKDEYPSGIESNIAYAHTIYDQMHSNIETSFQLPKGDKKRSIITGNEAISLGAIAAGLNAYYGYPMTPASSILHFLARHSKDFNLAVVHAENEISVINMALGSAVMGATTMVGSSGGGVALMTEGVSLAGMAEIPILIVLSMRSGPATGVPTYTEQGDLNYALSIGHGVFPRIVASPGSIAEAYLLTAEFLDLVWKFQTPGVLLTERHLSENSMTVEINIDAAKWSDPKMHNSGEYKRYLDTEDGVSPMLFPPSPELIKWNSYEHDELGITTEKADLVAKMHDKRFRKGRAIQDYLKNIHTVNVYGKGDPKIFTYGSTTMSVLEALEMGNIEASVIQPIYLSPFPVWELIKYKEEAVITVEQSKQGQFTNLIKEKAGITSHSMINKYDGRPFDPLDLANKIKEVL